MSNPAPSANATQAASAPAAPSPSGPGPDASAAGGLLALRATLDRIDANIHDLLMQRARVIEDVAKSGKRGALRPGREATIIRRLLARHEGTLPPQALFRIWRELLAATTAMQGNFAVAVCDRDTGAALTQLAREQFGGLTPLRTYGSPSQAIAELSAGTATVAVLPMPSETDSWWTALLHRDEPRIHVVARLPFWLAPRPDGAPPGQALVVATIAPDPSGQDRSLLGLELDEDVSRARLTGALTAAGLTPGSIVLRRDQAAAVAHALVEVEGMLEDDDPRLAGLGALLRRPVVLGGYAVPLGGNGA